MYYKGLVILGALLVGGLGYIISRNMPPVYQASTSLLVTPGSTQALDNYSSLIASERLAWTYAELLQSGPVLQETQRRLESPQSPADGSESAGFAVSARQTDCASRIT